MDKNINDICKDCIKFSRFKKECFVYWEKKKHCTMKVSSEEELQRQTSVLR